MVKVKEEKKFVPALSDEAMLVLCQDIKDNLNRTSTVADIARDRNVPEKIVIRAVRGLRKAGVKIPRKSHHHTDFVKIVAKLS